jgi:hypothetical protein
MIPNIFCLDYCRLAGGSIRCLGVFKKDTISSEFSVVTFILLAYRLAGVFSVAIKGSLSHYVLS